MTTKTSQCNYCAFNLTEDQSTIATERHIEEKYKTLRNLIDAPKKPRKIFVGGDDDKTETCFINSPNWVRRKENIHCPDRIDNSLSLQTALDLREARLANKLAEKANKRAEDANRTALAARIWAIIAAIIAMIAIIVPYIIPPPQ